MLKKMLKNNIVISNKNLNWKEATTIASAPLLKNNKITQDYIDSIFSTVEDMGFYFIISPKVAMPHSRPESGVNETSLSMLISSEPIEFGDNKNIHIVTTLAAKDNNSHMDLMSELAVFLSKENIIDDLLQVKSEQELLNLIKDED